MAPEPGIVDKDQGRGSWSFLYKDARGNTGRESAGNIDRKTYN